MRCQLAKRAQPPRAATTARAPRASQRDRRGRTTAGWLGGTWAPTTVSDAVGTVPMVSPQRGQATRPTTTGVVDGTMALQNGQVAGTSIGAPAGGGLSILQA